jgi:UDP-N-acetylmuramoylalanine-D-glutamate ligase
MESTRRGLESFAGKSVTVVLGGAAKGVDYAPLAKTIQEQGVQVCGVRSEVTDALVMLDASLEVYETAKDALSAAYKKTPARGVILVSPAGAFFASRYLPEGLPAAISSLQWRVTPPAPKT